MRNYGTHFDRMNEKKWADLLSSRGVGLILRSIKVDYKFVSRCDRSQSPLSAFSCHTADDGNQPMKWPDRISVYHKLRSRPDESSESIVLDSVIISETKQRPAARCVEDVVVYDYRSSKKTSLPPFVLDQFQRTYDLQEAAKVENRDKINHLIDRVRDLECASWDRPDAKEDLGRST